MSSGVRDVSRRLWGQTACVTRQAQSGIGEAPRPIFSNAAEFFCCFRVWLISLAVFCAAVTPGVAQVSREYQLKAVFLWRLAQFTQWPANAFEDPESPIVICVAGENPFSDALDAAVRDETAHGRKLVVQYYRNAEGIKICHILYLTVAVARQVKEVSAAVSGKSVLTVRATDGSERSYNTIVRFITEQNKIKLRIDIKSAKAARLVLDPRLLRAAEIVENE
jgi:hypothetical protein